MYIHVCLLRSVISGPLDEATDFGNLWERYIEAVRSLYTLDMYVCIYIYIYV